ncbi:MAG: alcohol dehydrogenase catalytic domain-containing protein [Gammaproteobacteria bacterium]|nr:alcohol dehydrogenase catalytic domain-containing protein [Gammaproteobacteria bacterium]
MRAWRLPRLGDPWTELAAVDMAEPTAKEATSLRSDAVVVRVDATDLNFADILQCRGQYQVRHEVPFTPGMNAAGTVVDSSPGSPHRIGERIVGPTVAPRGGFAECAVLAGELAHPVPEGVSSIDAMAAHITFGTAWFALHHRGRLQRPARPTGLASESWGPRLHRGADSQSARCWRESSPIRYRKGFLPSTRWLPTSPLARLGLRCIIAAGCSLAKRCWCWLGPVASALPRSEWHARTAAGWRPRRGVAKRRQSVAIWAPTR